MFDDLREKTYTRAELMQMKPLVLAFVGDCVYELYIRNYLISEKYRDVNELHRKSVFFVKAKAQAYILRALEPGAETRNATSSAAAETRILTRFPKTLEVADYRQATAYEALIGYLYLSGSVRLAAILEKSVAIGRMRNE